MPDKDWKPKQGDKVALASDIWYRGEITGILGPYTDDDQTMYYVAWKGNSQQYLYLREMLIPEKEAIAIEKAQKEKSDG